MLKIKKTKVLATVFETSQFPNDCSIDFITIGKSNVGKSSFINTILNRKKLAYVSQRAGKTQSINFYNVNNHFNIVDFPGYGYGKVSYLTKKKWHVLINHYFSKYNSRKILFFLKDIRRDFDDLDLQFLELVESYMIPVYFILTKSDKITKNKVRDVRQKTCKMLNLDKSQVIPFSSLKKVGKEEVLETIERLIEV